MTPDTLDIDLCDSASFIPTKPFPVRRIFRSDDFRQAERLQEPTKGADSGTAGDETGRGERIRTSGLHVPNVALYQAKLHPDHCVTQ